MVLSNSAKMTKPYSLSYAKRQLEVIRASNPSLYQIIEALLGKYEDNLKLNGSFQLSLNDRNKTTMAKPNELGNFYDSKGELYVSTQYQLFDWLSLSGGVSAINSFEETEFYNSYVSIGSEFIQVDVGYRSYWMSPFHSRALLNSNNAKQTLSAVLFNPEPFEFANLSYEIFLRDMEQHQRVKVNGEYIVGNPYMLGTHISFEPLEGLSLGFNRTFQFGGRGSSITTSDIWNAFTDAVGSDNYGELTDCNEVELSDCEFGNQRASITAKYNFSEGIPFSIYGEYAGEDAASHSNFFLGNLAVSFGVFIPQISLRDMSVALTYEITEYQGGWHSHHIYRDGYRINEVSSGHWGTNFVAGREATAGLSQYLKLEFNSSEHIIETEVFYHKNQLAAGQVSFPIDYEDVFKISVSYIDLNQSNLQYSVGLLQDYVGELTWSGDVKWSF